MSYKLPSVDQLIQLAKDSPEELERLRQKHIEHLIDSAPKALQRRLRGLQFQIDSRRRLHDNPMGSCVTLSKMMLDSLSQLNSALHGSLDAPRKTESPAAAILPFPAAANH